MAERLAQIAYPLSQPTPSLSPSKPCGSGGNTVKRRKLISPQSRSGGGGGMQTVGYEESQLAAGGAVGGGCVTGGVVGVGVGSGGGSGGSIGVSVGSDGGGSGSCVAAGVVGAGVVVPAVTVAVGSWSELPSSPQETARMSSRSDTAPPSREVFQHLPTAHLFLVALLLWLQAAGLSNEGAVIP